MKRSVLASLAAAFLFSAAAPALAQPYPSRGGYRQEEYRHEQRPDWGRREMPRYAEAPRYRGGYGYGYAEPERDEGPDMGAIMFGVIAGGMLAAALSHAGQ